jgi:hypothetical protein
MAGTPEAFASRLRRDNLARASPWCKRSFALLNSKVCVHVLKIIYKKNINFENYLQK